MILSKVEKKQKNRLYSTKKHLKCEKHRFYKSVFFNRMYIMYIIDTMYINDIINCIREVTNYECS